MALALGVGLVLVARRKKKAAPKRRLSLLTMRTGSVLDAELHAVRAWRCTERAVTAAESATVEAVNDRGIVGQVLAPQRELDPAIFTLVEAIPKTRRQVLHVRLRPLESG